MNVLDVNVHIDVDKSPGSRELSPSCLPKIEAHESLHDQMEELAFVDEAVLQAEHVERDKHDAIHAKVFAELGDLHTRLDLWGVGMDLNNDLEALRALKEPGKPHFIKAYEEFRKGVKDLGHQCRGYMEDENISVIMKTLHEAVTNLSLEVKRALSDAPAAVSTATTVAPPAVKAAPINVQLPKFDGNPLQWRHFSNLFLTAMRTRASGFSELDKRCLLVESLLSKEAKDEVSNSPEDATLTDLMDLLQKRFSRAQTVVPILISQVTKPNVYSADYHGLQKLNQQVFKGVDALKHFMGDFLSVYMMYSATMMFSPKLKAEWDLHVIQYNSEPTWEDLRKYVSARLLQLPATDAPTSSAPVAQATAATSNPPSISVTKPTRPKTPFKCIICEEKHGLVRCPTFIAWDVDKRNKVIREKRLCINCFSDAHGYKSCTTKFSCRTCHAKHHTLLHKDKPINATSDSYAVSASSPIVDSSLLQASP